MPFLQEHAGTCGKVRIERNRPSNRLLGGLDEVSKIDLDSMASAIASAVMLYRNLAIQCEDKGEPTQDYYFADVCKVIDTDVGMRCIDGLGRRVDGVCTVPLDEITLFEMGTSYLTRFARYVD